MDFPEPTVPIADERQALLGYLDYFRAVVLEKVTGVDLHVSTLPSGWTPGELVNHLRHVERRWLEWGFEGHAISDPWADRQDDRWHTTDDLVTLTTNLGAQAATTRRIVESHDLDHTGQPGERWDGADPPPLRRVLLHLVQEYARHVGHLDVVRELRDGATGE
ncbi:MAG: Mini-circle protein [Frankiales bacterium]|nr:Mini-circle protein [Frankiales bacterium]